MMIALFWKKKYLNATLQIINILMTNVHHHHHHCIKKVKKTEACIKTTIIACRENSHESLCIVICISLLLISVLITFANPVCFQYRIMTETYIFFCDWERNKPQSTDWLYILRFLFIVIGLGLSCDSFWDWMKLNCLFIKKCIFLLYFTRHTCHDSWS